MNLTIIIQDSIKENTEISCNQTDYEGKTTSTTICTEDFDGEELITYTKYTVSYNDDLPTWLDNIDQCVKALEKYYGYKFDMKKYAKRIKNKETDVTQSKTRLSEFFSEDPDH